MIYTKQEAREFVETVAYEACVPLIQLNEEDVPVTGIKHPIGGLYFYGPSLEMRECCSEDGDSRRVLRGDTPDNFIEKAMIFNLGIMRGKRLVINAIHKKEEKEKASV